MRIALTGSSGFLGRLLVPGLRSAGHGVLRLVRRPPHDPEERPWNPLTESPGELAETLAEVEAVIHLAGENLGAGRWTGARRQRIRESRIASTRLMAEALALLSPTPRVFLCASAIGWYGDRGETWVDEDSSPGRGFLAELCQEWEAAADPARAAGIRTVHFRFGMLLGPGGGALARMLPAFRLGLGGPLGNGRQWWSWLARQDAVGILLHALDHEELEGPVNAVAPEPIRNRDFGRGLGEVLCRGAWLPAPASLLRLALGGMANELLLASTRVRAKRLSASGYRYRIPEFLDALRKAT